MADGLRRFLHLERPRREGADGAPVARASRFDAVAGPATPTTPTPPTSTATAARFRDPPPSSALELDVAADDEQPFRRCCHCEVDSGRFASACSSCGADLLSDEQRVFNERLWAERRLEAANIERENAERREAARRAEEEGARAQRAAAEALAREVGDRERRRLEHDGWGRGSTWGEDDDAWPGREVRPVGLRLLALIRDPRWRMGVIAALLACVLGAVLYALARRQPGAIVVVAFVVSLLFSPRRPRWRRRFWR